MGWIPKCNCKGCTNDATVKIPLDRRGGRNSYLCDFHATRMESYYYENDTKKGVEKKSQATFGCEFETSYSDEKARAEFIANGYIPTSDCTVNVEYKSPIMIGLNSFSKQCKTFENLINNGHLRVGSECGTHFHYGNIEWITPDTMQYIRRFYHSLFIPLCEIMQEHRNDNIRLWGRDFGRWASEINEYSNATEHTNFINVQHDHTLEFRICKFKSARQMALAAKTVKAMGDCIITNFVQHFNDEYDTRIYANITKYRKHKASVTAQKLVKIYLKAIDEI